MRDDDHHQVDKCVDNSRRLIPGSLIACGVMGLVVGVGERRAPVLMARRMCGGFMKAACRRTCCGPGGTLLGESIPCRCARGG